MATDDFVESEVALAVAATAALFSPPVRALMRRGAIAGLSGALKAIELVRSSAQLIGQERELMQSHTLRGLEDITERS